jgi:hypothetical protein
MEILKQQLDELIAELENETQLKERLENLVSVCPFNEFASYEVNARSLLQAIRDAFKRQMARKRA